MKLCFVVIALLAVTVVPCHARLGETLDQCVTRYGEAVITFPGMANGLPGDSRVVFKKSGFVITVIIFKGVVAQEIMYKDDLSDVDQTELNALMDAESANLSWTERNESYPNLRTFDRDDGAIAQYLTDKHELHFISKEYLAALADKQKADQDAKLPGF